MYFLSFICLSKNLNSKNTLDSNKNNKEHYGLWRYDIYRSGTILIDYRIVSYVLSCSLKIESIKKRINFDLNCYYALLN